MKKYPYNFLRLLKMEKIKFKLTYRNCANILIINNIHLQFIKSDWTTKGYRIPDDSVSFLFSSGEKNLGNAITISVMKKKKI